jgi:DNA-binding CsgD family transcriptional regulator
MMFQWTDGEVSHIVRLALESARSSAGSYTPPHRSRLIETLAAEVSASAWHAHTIDLGSILGQRQLPWTMIASDPGHDWSRFCPFEFYGTHLEQLLSSVRLSGRAAEEVGRRCCEQAQGGAHHALAWLAVRPQGNCACVEFLKPATGGAFTLRDEAVVRILSTELFPEPASPARHSAAADGDALVELPRRQREVLSALLVGSSVKEIASDLGISPYTVNDYIKALYRRYQVSSRGELLAAMHGLRRPMAPK